MRVFITGVRAATGVEPRVLAATRVSTLPREQLLDHGFCVGQHRIEAGRLWGAVFRDERKLGRRVDGGCSAIPGFVRASCQLGENGENWPRGQSYQPP